MLLIAPPRLMPDPFCSRQVPKLAICGFGTAPPPRVKEKPSLWFTMPALPTTDPAIVFPDPALILTVVPAKKNSDRRFLASPPVQFTVLVIPRATSVIAPT